MPNACKCETESTRAGVIWSDKESIIVFKAGPGLLLCVSKKAGILLCYPKLKPEFSFSQVRKKTWYKSNRKYFSRKNVTQFNQSSIHTPQLFTLPPDYSLRYFSTWIQVGLS